MKKLIWLLLCVSAFAQIKNSPSSIPKPNGTGQCFVSTGTNVGNWNWGSCSGSSTSNFSTMAADAPNTSGGSYTYGNGTGATYSGTGYINSNRLIGTAITALLGNSGKLLQGQGAFTAGNVLTTDATGNAIDSGYSATTIGTAVTGQASSVDSELALFNGITGKSIKRASMTGIPKLTSGVLGTAVAADFPTLNQNTTGTASNLSGTPALPNGTTATTQTQGDNSTKLSTTGYVDAGLGTKVSTTTTVNGHALSGNVTVTPGDVGNTTAQWNANQINGQSLGGLATGILKNTTSTGVPSIATSSDVDSLYAGAGPCYLKKGGTCDSTPGAGTVTNGSGALTLNKFMLGNGSTDSKVDSACTSDGSGNITGCASVTLAPNSDAGIDFPANSTQTVSAAGASRLISFSNYLQLSNNAGSFYPLATTAGTRTTGKQLNYDANGNIAASSFDVGGGYVSAPATPSDSGSNGQWSTDANYLYVYGGGRWQRLGYDTSWSSASVATPSFSAGTGTYDNDQSITISDSTSGATLCYTTDGSAPGASTPGTCDSSPTSTYSTAISITSTGTVLKAIGTKATLTNSGVQSATYTLTAGNPSASPTAGTYSGTQSVTLSTSTTSGSIRYTTNGSTPACPSTGTSYTGAISVATTTTIKAIACKTNYNASAVQTFAYTITGGGGGGIARVGTGTTAFNSGATSIATSSYNVGTGNLLYCIVGATSNLSGTTITLSDTAGNTFTQIGSNNYQSFAGSAAFYAKNTTANASDVITASFGSTTASIPRIACEQFSGLSTTAPLDASPVTSHAAASPITSASFSTATANEVIIMGAFDYYAPNDYAASSIGGTSANLGIHATGSSSGDGTIGIEYLIVSSTQSSITASMTKTGNVYSNEHTASFK